MHTWILWEWQKYGKNAQLTDLATPDHPRQPGRARQLVFLEVISSLATKNMFFWGKISNAMWPWSIPRVI